MSITGVQLVTRSKTVVRRGLNGLRTVDNNLQWLAQVSFGSPAQQFELLIDTGSSNVLVTSTECSRPECRTKSPRSYDLANSYRFGRTYSMMFAGGTSLVNELVKDVVTLGEHQIKSQIFGATSEIQNSDIDFDGILGLGFKTIIQPSDAGINTVLDAMFDQKLASIFFIIHIKITEKLFAVKFIKQELGGGGELTFGRYNKSIILGDVIWVNNTDKYFWTAILDDIYVDDIDLEVGGPFIFDTGATYIYAPCSIVELIYDSIPGSQLFVDGTWVLPCNHTDNKYDVKLLFKDHNFTIPIQDFIQEPVNATGLPDDIDPTGLCLGGAQQSDSDYIIGAIFFKLFYVIFDLDKNRIGLAYREDVHGSDSY
ncbi:5638_t:CDS:2 [Ambispora gerdemannii]|uniref:5638_t:CDS:1 n=1 Tax=Ambispora gerdemannii TaxID=144530 RepID=A0A9N9A7A5_9GLOM|nr:5638_t:CDS:2 [Ambispora gerdemannii]